MTRLVILSTPVSAPIITAALIENLPLAIILLITPLTIPSADFVQYEKLTLY